jgi:hypothetical protein
MLSLIRDTKNQLTVLRSLGLYRRGYDGSVLVSKTAPAPVGACARVFVSAKWPLDASICTVRLARTYQISMETHEIRCGVGLVSRTRKTSMHLWSRSENGLLRHLVPPESISLVSALLILSFSSLLHWSSVICHLPPATTSSIPPYTLIRNANAPC